MVKRRTDSCFPLDEGCSVARVQFPASPVQRIGPPAHQALETENTEDQLCCSHRDPENGESSGEAKSKRVKQEKNEEVTGSSDITRGVPIPDQQKAAEDSRAAKLQSAGSLKVTIQPNNDLKVTIQQSSESRGFGPAEKTSEKQTGELQCHVCNLTCCSLQMFQEHMSGQEHLKKLQEMTHCIHLNTHTLLDSRGRCSERQAWCDTCQIHFNGNVIEHRRTKQHKICKQLCRPFCPVCKRQFRTPRKFVEHMKSAEHKQRVQLNEVQEEELITLDAVGCFEEDEEEEAEVADEESERAEQQEVAEAAATEEEDEENDGSSFVIPVSGFLCQLCNKFFHKKHIHCSTVTHRFNLQSHKAKKKKEEEAKEQNKSI